MWAGNSDQQNNSGLQDNTAIQEIWWTAQQSRTDTRKNINSGHMQWQHSYPGQILDRTAQDNSVRFKDSTLIQDMYKPAQQSRYICRTAQKSKADKRQHQHSNPRRIRDNSNLGHMQDNTEIQDRRNKTAIQDICRIAQKSSTDTRQYSNSGHTQENTAIHDQNKTAPNSGHWLDSTSIQDR